MYQVIFDNGRDRKTLYKNENFGKVLDEGWKPLIIGLCSAGLVALTLIEYFIFPDPGPSTLLLLGIGIIVLIGASHLFKH